MTLEAVVYQQQQQQEVNICSLIEKWGWDFDIPKHNQEDDQQDEDEINRYLGLSFSGNQLSEDQQWDLEGAVYPWAATSSSSSSARPKRRRGRGRKNLEEIENQRMTHIAVERNRRKQMNEYLSVLKSLMPDSYSQRGDQASIVGGAINTVKELEQNLNCLISKRQKMQNNIPFGEFFSFPQYSTTGDTTSYSEASRVADVEVTMVESHANLKIRSRIRPKQLLKIVSGLQQMRLSILHLNVNTANKFALYSLSVKVEDDSQLNSADEIAAAAHQLLANIQQEASSTST